MAIETLTRKETIIQEVELPKQSDRRNLRLDALLILITIIWGSTFLIVKNTEKLTGPFTFLALCFGLHSRVKPSLPIHQAKLRKQITWSKRWREQPPRPSVIVL